MIEFARIWLGELKINDMFADIVDCPEHRAVLGHELDILAWQSRCQGQNISSSGMVGDDQQGTFLGKFLLDMGGDAGEETLHAATCTFLQTVFPDGAVEPFNHLAEAHRLLPDRPAAGCDSTGCWRAGAATAGSLQMPDRGWPFQGCYRENGIVDSISIKIIIRSLKSTSPHFP